MNQTNKWLVVMAVTVLRVPASIVIVIAAAGANWWLVFWAAVVGFVTDYIDGQLARRWKVTSEVGMFLDPLMDKVICLTLLAVLAAAGHPWFWLLFAVFFIYDVFTMSLRVMLSRFIPMPAHKTAKLKTATLMAGLLVAILGQVYLPSTVSGVLIPVAFCLLVVAAILTIKSGLEYLRWVRRMRLGDWLEMHENVTQINFDAWYADGIRAMLFDIEGTLTQWKDPDVPPEIAKAIKRARKAGIKRIGLVTNMHRKYAARAGYVARQIEADTFHFPASMFDRKPNPMMAEYAMQALSMKPGETAFVGDKVIDVLTGSAAGVHKVAWVERLGKADHAYDRYIYRHAERQLKKFLRRW